jgi:transposase InsO family protein
MGGKLEKFVQERGIKQKLSTPYTLAQNGLVERDNPTFLAKFRCMLQAKGLSPKFWAEVVNTTTNIVNRTCNSVLSGNIPLEHG